MITTVTPGGIEQHLRALRTRSFGHAPVFRSTAEPSVRAEIRDGKIRKPLEITR